MKFVCCNGNLHKRVNYESSMCCGGLKYDIYGGKVCEQGQLVDRPMDDVNLGKQFIDYLKESGKSTTVSYAS